MTSTIDTTFTSWLLGFAGRWHVLDDLVVLIVHNDLVKGGVFIAILWWLWARPGRDQERHREIVVATYASALAAALSSRSIAVLYPFRGRPINTPGLDIPPEFIALVYKDAHGSFPSDHAALAFALATGIFVASPVLGALSMVYMALLVCLPRVYVGFHWLTDILGGAFLGVAVAWILTRPGVRSRLARPVLAFFARFPGPAYAGMFLLSDGILTRFDDVRALAKWLLHAMSGGGRLA